MPRARGTSADGRPILTSAAYSGDLVGEAEALLGMAFADGIELAGADLPAAWLSTAPDVDELGSRTIGGNPANDAWSGTRPTGQMDRAGPGPSGTPLPGRRAAAVALYSR